MPTPHEAARPAAGPDPGPPADGRLPDRGPRYTETPPDPYAPDAPPVAEPWNAVTASLFVAIALAWAWRLRGRYRRFPFLCCCLPILLAGGVGGTLYHALRTQAAYFWLDVIPIQLLGLAGAVFLAVRLSRRWAWLYALGAAAVYLVLNRVFFAVIPAPGVQLAVNLSYASLAALVVAPMALVLVRTRFRHAGWVVLGVTCFVVAWFFRLWDQTAGPYLPMGSHWLWHTFGAACTAAMIEYFYRLEGEAAPERAPPPGG